MQIALLHYGLLFTNMRSMISDDEKWAADPTQDSDAELYVTLLNSAEQLRSSFQNLGTQELGSAFDGDRKRAPEYSMSVTARLPIQNALNSLGRLREATVSEKETEVSIGTDIYLPLAMVRQALDLIVTAAWLLLPDNRTERLRRAFEVHYENVRHHHLALEAYGHLDEEKRANELSRVEFLANKAGIEKIHGSKRKTLTSTVTMLQQIENSDTYRTTALEGSWRVCSGFAHGMHWTHQQIAERNNPVDDPSNRATTYDASLSVKTVNAMLAETLNIARQTVQRFMQMNSNARR